MAEAKQKMGKYKVKSRIEYGIRNEEITDPKNPDFITNEVYEAGDTIELTEEEAIAIAHALHNAPAPSRALEIEGEDVDEDLEDAIQSINDRPDNPNSGIQQHWQVDEIARRAANTSRARMASGTKAVGHGFERAHGEPTGELGPMASNPPQPESNKTPQQLEFEEQQQKLREKEEKAAAKKAGDK